MIQLPVVQLCRAMNVARTHHGWRWLASVSIILSIGQSIGFAIASTTRITSYISNYITVARTQLRVYTCTSWPCWQNIAYRWSNRVDTVPQMHTWTCTHIQTHYPYFVHMQQQQHRLCAPTGARKFSCKCVCLWNANTLLLHY